jgi:hypothetical protein
MPIFIKRPHVTRSPSLHLLARTLNKSKTVPKTVDGRNTFYVLDPGADLGETHRRMAHIFERFIIENFSGGIDRIIFREHWRGLRPGLLPSPAEITSALETSDIFMYLYLFIT